MTPVCGMKLEGTAREFAHSPLFFSHSTQWTATNQMERQAEVAWALEPLDER